MKRALIIGILGQDGSYLAEHLYKNNYQVYGIIRPTATLNKTNGYDWISAPDVTISRIDILDQKALTSHIKEVNPDEIYNFAGVSNVFKAWENMDEVFELNARVPQNIIRAILETNPKIRYFQASSCLVFGRNRDGVQNERTQREPIHPYGAAKLYADNMINEAREVYGIYGCSGIFFNHDSTRRNPNFLSRKVAVAVARIKRGEQDKLQVGNLSGQRDMGYAPDYVKAAHLMLQQSKAKDYVIGTGKLISMQEFVNKCFEYVNLEPGDHIEYVEELDRKIDVQVLRADITKITKDLGWVPEHSIEEVISIMIDSELG